MCQSQWAQLGLQSAAIVMSLLAVCLPVAAETPAALPATGRREIESAVAAEMARLKIPGLSVAVGVDLRLAWSGGFGMADLENSVPATASTVYRLGSISKPITAVAAMQLSERGKLDLDAPIQTYVPSFPRKPWPITPRELLAHLSGIRHYSSAAEVNSARHYSDLLEPLRIFADEPLLFEPGTRYSYSTYGYNLLGAAIEAASGRKFLDYLRENVFEPAGMDRIQQDDVYRVVPHRARGYRRVAAGEIQNCALADTSNKIPAGGLVSTAADLVRFAAAFERGALVPKHTLELMLTPQHTRDGRPTWYGLGWRIEEHGGRKWAGHTGAQQGVSTLLLTCPADGFSLAILANLEGVNLVPLSTRIAAALLP